MQEYETNQTLISIWFFHQKLQIISNQVDSDFETISALALKLEHDYFAIFRYIHNVEYFRSPRQYLGIFSSDIGRLVPKELKNTESRILENIVILSRAYSTLLKQVMSMCPKSAEGQNEQKALNLAQLIKDLSDLNSSQPTWDEVLDRHLGKNRDIQAVYKNGQNDLDIESMLAINEVFNILERFVGGNVLQIDDFLDVLPPEFSFSEFRILMQKAIFYLTHKIRSLEMQDNKGIISTEDPNYNVFFELERMDRLKQCEELEKEWNRISDLRTKMIAGLELCLGQEDNEILANGLDRASQMSKLLNGIDIDGINSVFDSNHLIMQNIVDDKLQVVNIALDVLAYIDAYRFYIAPNGNSAFIRRLERGADYAELFLSLPEKIWAYFIDQEFNDSIYSDRPNKTPLKDFLLHNADLTSDGYESFCEFANARHPSLDFGIPVSEIRPTSEKYRLDIYRAYLDAKPGTLDSLIPESHSLILIKI